MTETLKPCPFCGDKAVLKEDTRWHGAFRVECSSCDATVWATGANNPASAIAHWNRRVAPHEPGEACPDCGYDVLVTDPDLRDPVEARVHAPDCPRTRYVVEYGVEAPPNVRHVRPHRSGCGHYDCAASRPDAGDGTGETG